LALVRDRLFPGGLGNVVLALAHRNYRIYAGGNAVSLVGIWMQRVAVGWLAWTLTHSGTWLGVMSMAEFFPVVFLSPLAGALADRRDRVGIIRVTQIAGSTEATRLLSWSIPIGSRSSCCWRSHCSSASSTRWPSRRASR
jgi:hypothetical protein